MTRIDGRDASGVRCTRKGMLESLHLVHAVAATALERFRRTPVRATRREEVGEIFGHFDLEPGEEGSR